MRVFKHTHVLAVDSIFSSKVVYLKMYELLVECAKINMSFLGSALFRVLNGTSYVWRLYPAKSKIAFEAHVENLKCDIYCFPRLYIFMQICCYETLFDIQMFTLYLPLTPGTVFTLKTDFLCGFCFRY